VCGCYVVYNNHCSQTLGGRETVNLKLRPYTGRDTQVLWASQGRSTPAFYLFYSKVIVGMLSSDIVYLKGHWHEKIAYTCFFGSFSREYKIQKISIHFITTLFMMKEIFG